MAVEENDHQRGAARVEAFGNVQQNARIVEGQVLPVDVALRRAMATPARVIDIEERLALAGHLAVVGEGRRFELDQLSACVRERRAP